MTPTQAQGFSQTRCNWHESSIKTLNEIVTGDGEPKKGLVYRMEAIDVKVKILLTMSTAILLGMLSVIWKVFVILPK